MSDLTILPADIAEMPASQLAKLPPHQLLEIDNRLDQAVACLKKTRAQVDAALELRFGEQARTGAGKDFGAVQLTEGPLRVTADLPKRVSWDQPALAAMARRIAASGEQPEDYLDIEYSVSESRFNNWPPTLREQFAPARTVKPGKPSFRLALNPEVSP